LEAAMSEVPATEFKAKCLELMDRVAEKSESFTITKRGKPVARLVPVGPAKKKDRLFGALRGLAWETGDIVSPVDGLEWETLRKWDELEKEIAPRLPTRRRRVARRK
jgi:prevent-host-death family protein